MYVLDVNGLNSNDMKQTIQHTAVQKAMQPVARYIKTGLEHVAIYIYMIQMKTYNNKRMIIQQI